MALARWDNRTSCCLKPAGKVLPVVRSFASHSKESEIAIEVKFKKSEDGIADYEVSFEGEAPVSKGRGADARSQAVSAFEHYRQVRHQREKYLKALDVIEKIAIAEGSLTAESDADGEVYHSVEIDGQRVYEGYDIDDLNIILSQDRKPSEGHRGPGF